MKKLLRRILDEGTSVISGMSSHARQESEKDKLTDVDIVNVLRGGVVREAEFENGGWRYRVETAKIVVVITLNDEPEIMPPESEPLDEDIELVSVTAWRRRQ
jgi:voltage-gated potassium channel Kch